MLAGATISGKLIAIANMLEQSQVNRSAICQRVCETDVQIFMPRIKLKTKFHRRKQDRNRAS
jgi:hypothetical protein